MEVGVAPLDAVDGDVRLAEFDVENTFRHSVKFRVTLVTVCCIWCPGF